MQGLYDDIPTPEYQPGMAEQDIASAIGVLFRTQDLRGGNRFGEDLIKDFAEAHWSNPDTAKERLNTICQRVADTLRSHGIPTGGMVYQHPSQFMEAALRDGGSY